jgi:hypothetical protein
MTTPGDTKREVRVYSLEVRVTVYPSGSRWLCEDHTGHIMAFPTEALANHYAEATIVWWERLVRENP